jgi:hypothetical protein
MHACLHVHTLHWLDKLSLMTLFLVGVAMQRSEPQP